MRPVTATAAFAAVFACHTTHAQAPTPPVEAYGRLPSVMQAEISPDGEQIGFLMQLDDGIELRIFDAREQAITGHFNATGLKTRGMMFPDENHVILLASETTQPIGFRNEFEFSAAISINLETEESRQLLSQEDALAPQAGLGQIVGQLPSGRVLMPAYVDSPGHMPDYDLMKVDLDRKDGQIHAYGDSDVVSWFVDKEGNAFIRELYDQRNNRYAIEHLGPSGWTELMSIEDVPEVPMSIIATAQNEKSVYAVRNDDEGEGYSSLIRINLDGSTEATTYAKEGADIGGVITDVSRHFLGIQYSGVLPTYELADPALKESYETVSSQLPGARITLDSWSDDRSRILYNVFDGFQVDFWLLHDRSQGMLQFLISSRNDIPKEAVGSVYTIEYEARDGLRIPSILTLPPGKTLEADLDLPMILLPHGGPAAHDSFRFDWLSQFFANRGYLVIQPNFRGSTGFGRAFQEAGTGEWGKKMQDDLTDAVKTMVEAGYADPERVCIVGASYGGYAALAGGAFTPELYKCIGAVAPVSDLNEMMSWERRRHGQHSSLISYWERVIGGGDTSQERLDEVSPAKFANAFEAPVLLIHGRDDTVVPDDQSRIMKRALDRADHPVKLVTLNGGDHWLSDSETRLATLKALASFVDENIGE